MEKKLKNKKVGLFSKAKDYFNKGASYVKEKTEQYKKYKEGEEARIDNQIKLKKKQLILLKKKNQLDKLNKEYSSKKSSGFSSSGFGFSNSFSIGEEPKKMKGYKKNNGNGIIIGMKQYK